MRKHFPVLALVLFAAVPAFAQFGFNADTAPKATIEGSLHKRAGDDVEGTVTVKIADGWHVNSNTPSEDFAIPTKLELDAENGRKVLKLMEALEDQDDVQSVTSNYNIPDEIMEEVTSGA